MKEEQIEIRYAIKDDSQFLADLMTHLGYKTSNNDMKERFTNIYNHSDYKTFVACIAKDIVGMAGAIQCLSYEQNGKYVRLIALVTNPICRKKGIGKKLLQAVENWAKEVDAKFLLLNCGNREERRQAHIFYRNRGFAIKSFGYIKKI